MVRNPNYQYEALPVPRGWNDDERQLVARLTELFDIIFSWKGRLRVEDLATDTARRILSVGGLNVNQIKGFEEAVSKLAVEAVEGREIYLSQLKSANLSALRYLATGEMTDQEGYIKNTVRQTIPECPSTFEHSFDADTGIHTLTGAGMTGIALMGTALTAVQTLMVNGSPVALYRNGTTVTTLPAGHWISFIYDEALAQLDLI